MMYANKFAAALKVNGRVLREVEDSVFIPFGAEYAITLKNLNVRKALVNIEIDGKDVTGGGLVIEAGRSIDLERFIENGNLSAGQRFKFIERTAKIENGPRGIKVEDGTIRVRFAFDNSPIYYQRQARLGTLYSKGGSNQTFDSYDVGGSRSIGDTMLGGIAKGNAEYFSNSAAPTKASHRLTKSSSVQSEVATSSLPKNDVGITVGGSLSSQSFVEVSEFSTGPEEVLVFRVFGDVNGEPVAKPMTVKTLVQCPTCGTSNSFGTKFCGECGTGLLTV
jgi:hypothetical protein